MRCGEIWGWSMLERWRRKAWFGDKGRGDLEDGRWQGRKERENRRDILAFMFEKGAGGDWWRMERTGEVLRKECDQAEASGQKMGFGKGLSSLWTFWSPHINAIFGHFAAPPQHTILSTTTLIFLWDGFFCLHLQQPILLEFISFYKKKQKLN